MTATKTSTELPSTGAALVFAIGSAIVMPIIYSVSRNDVIAVLLMLTGVAGTLWSTRFSVQTYRRLARHGFQVALLPRWVMLVLALSINGVVCLMLTGMTVIILGIFITGRGMVG